MPDRSAQDRIVNLETQLAHLERYVDQLNEVIIMQGERLDRALRRLDDAEGQIKSLKNKPDNDTDPIDEKPPHY